jgi:hypothetical protein
MLVTATAATALAVACGSKSSNNGEGAGDGGGGTPSSSSSSSSGGAQPAVPLDAGSVDFVCQSAANCTAPQLCCGTFGVTSATSACATGPCPTASSAGGFPLQLCASDTECPGGGPCQPLSGFNGIDVCVADDGGTSMGIVEGDGSVFIVEAGPPTPEAGTTPHDASSEVEASVTEAGSTKDASTPDASEEPKDASESTTEAGPHDAAGGG